MRWCRPIITAIWEHEAEGSEVQCLVQAKKKKKGSVGWGRFQVQVQSVFNSQYHNMKEGREGGRRGGLKLV